MFLGVIQSLCKQQSSSKPNLDSIFGQINEIKTPN
jgi:hypothetical protein